MVTKRKSNKVRDAGQTQRDLIDAVGRLLGEQGFRSLNTTNIAEAVGRDRSMIRYHFESVEALQKAYIDEHDHWPPFFQRFALGQDPSKEKVQAMFTELMQENFRYFWDNPQMQQIILWQISEDNPLLRAVSESREKEGARLLERTDGHFEGSGVNFRALLALLLGGIYYVVLHARYNKSTVSGIDANKAEDREELLKTIAQVLDWAWAAAERKI